MAKQLRILIILCLVLLVATVIFTFYNTVCGNFMLTGIGGAGLLVLVAILTVLFKNLRIARTMGDMFEPYDHKKENGR